MLFVIDTNVFLRYVLQDDAVQSPLATSLIENHEHTFIFSIQMVCEVIWVLKRLKASRNDLIALINTIIETKNFRYDDSVMRTGLAFLKGGGDFADGVIANKTQHFEHVQLLTFDKKAQNMAKDLGMAVYDFS